MEALIWLGLVLAGAGAWVYNLLIRRRNQVAEAWSGIDVQLQRRHELVPNLVATVRGYMRHEADVLQSVTLARSSRFQDISEIAPRESALSRSIARLFALAEHYPDLKANEAFGQLHRSLVEIEDHLQYARRYYNGAVRDHNNLVESFPSNVVARMFGFRSAGFFEIELATHRVAPGVQI